MFSLKWDCGGISLALRRVEFLHRHNFTVIEEEKFEENYSN
jgi:hypothetical protein